MDKRRTQSETDSISHTARRHYFCMLQLLPEPSGHRSTKWLQKKSEVDNTRSRTGEICQKDKGPRCSLLGSANHWANELSGRGTSHSRCHLRHSKTHTR